MGMEPLSLKSVVLFIACGVLLFIIVFIFAKRQITRFTLKSRSGPHAEIGEDAPTALKEEIHARLKRVVEIKCEPQLISAELQMTTQQLFNDGKNHYWYRMKAMDTVKSLDEAFKSTHDLVRRPGETAASFLRTHGPTCNVPSNLVDSFVLTYNHARYGQADFTKQHFTDFTTLIENVIEHVLSAPASGTTDEVKRKAGAPLVGVTYRARRHRHDNTQSGQEIMTASGAPSNVNNSTNNLAGYCKASGITGSVV